MIIYNHGHSFSRVDGILYVLAVCAGVYTYLHPFYLPPMQNQPITFVSNIAYAVSRKCLYDLFIQITPIKKLEYKSKIAFVEYHSIEDQEQSLDALQNIRLFGRRIVLQRVEPPSTVRIRCEEWCDRAYLQDVFGRFGACKCSRDGTGFVCVFRRRGDAERAVRTMNQRDILGSVLYLVLERRMVA